MTPAKTLCIHYGRGNTVILPCNDVVIVEINEKLNYVLNPHENTEHIEYIETLYENRLLLYRVHGGDKDTRIKLSGGGTIYTLKTDNSKVVSLGQIEQGEGIIKILVVGFKKNKPEYMCIDDLQLIETF